MAGKDSPTERRRFLAQELRRRGASCALISHPKHIFYFTGFPTNLNMWYSIMKGPRSTSFLVVDSEGCGALLMAGTEVANPFTGERSESASGLELGTTEYIDYSLSTEMVTYGDRLSHELKRWLQRLGVKLDRVAIEEWNLAEVFRATVRGVHPEAKFEGLSGFLLKMRNSKGRDEIEYIEKAVRMVDSAYGVAKKTVRRGSTELEVYGAMNAASFQEFGPFGWIVGDHASGERSLSIGGAPTSNKMKSGDTIILDLQAAHNNYWADLCRTFVAGKPSRAQAHALSVLKEVKEVAENVLHPGTQGREVYRAVSDVLVKSGYPKLPHHAGHCIGLDDQEPPWFIPAERRTLEEGSVCVVEPGVYRKDSGGIRIEDQYVVTKSGPKKLSRFPLALS